LIFACVLIHCHVSIAWITWFWNHWRRWFPNKWCLVSWRNNVFEWEIRRWIHGKPYRN